MYYGRAIEMMNSHRQAPTKTKKNRREFVATNNGAGVGANVCEGEGVKLNAQYN